MTLTNNISLYSISLPFYSTLITHHCNLITNPNPIDGMTDVRGRANVTTPQTKQASGSKSRPADGDIAPTVGRGHLAPSPPLPAPPGGLQSAVFQLCKRHRRGGRRTCIRRRSLIIALASKQCAIGRRVRCHPAALGAAPSPLAPPLPSSPTDRLFPLFLRRTVHADVVHSRSTYE